MEFCFQPMNRDRFCMRNRHPFEQMMNRHYGHPFDIYDEDFHLHDYTFPLIKRHVSFVVPKGKCFRKREENNEKNKQECTQPTDQDQSPSDKETSEDKVNNETKTDKLKEEKSLQHFENFFKNFINLEEIFPSFGNLSSHLRTSEEDPFEVNVNLRGCDPDKIKVEIKDGVLKVEGRRESSDGSFTFVKHEQSIPKKVSSHSLKAYLLPEGLLILRQEEQSHYIPVALITEDNPQQMKETENVLEK